ncbi:MAG TPA: sugar phosphate isomerase/epimerase [Actinomycetota bacterium]|jgi:sugar phosphate isomerase/epimerase|nr:sugar phosphate isomerase/epimerase [Actinomycetota bacterium]
MDSPRLLFSSAAFFARPLGETFRIVADAGYAGVEVMVTKDAASQDPRRMRELAEQHDLTIGAIHAPCLLLTRRIWGTDPIGKIYRAVEVAEEVGAPLVVVHPPYRWQFPYRRWLEDRLPAFAKEAGIEVAVENMFPVRVAGRELTFHANQDLDELDPFGSLVLDTSHAAVAAHDLLQVRELFGNRLRHVHLSDNAGRGWDSHLPLGEGVLPIDGFLDDLAESGFGGTVTLEVDLRRHMADPEVVLEIMRADRERCEARLAPTR